MELEYYKRSVYGTTNIYLIGKPGQAIARLTGKKTITGKDMVALGELGFTFKQVFEPEI